MAYSIIVACEHVRVGLTQWHSKHLGTQHLGTQSISELSISELSVYALPVAARAAWPTSAEMQVLAMATSRAV